MSDFDRQLRIGQLSEGLISNVNNISRLRRLAEQLPELGADGEWLSSALERYLENAAYGLTIEHALGIATPSGGRPWWWHEERGRQREAARHLAALFPDAQSKASAICRALSNYAQGRYRFDCDKDTPVLVDPKRRDMHELITAAGGRVPTRRAIERLLFSCDRSYPRSCRSTDEKIASHDE